MKKIKKNAAKFQQLSADEMQKITGGIWVEIIDKDGKPKTIWIE